MMTVIGSAVLAALAQVISPEKWQKYIKIVTGIMIISVIIAPVYELKGIDIFSGFEYESDIDEYAQKKAVAAELERRISEDVVLRIKNELGVGVRAEAAVSLNENYEIEGVEEISVWTDQSREKIRQILQEVYSPQKISFQD